MAYTSCDYCGAPIVQPDGPGRPRLYCDVNHRMAAYRLRRARALTAPKLHAA